MRDRDESRRQGYGPRGDEGGEPDQWRHREDQDEWRHGSRWMHGSDRGWDRSGGGWRPEDRGQGEREETGYGPRGGEGYQGGYNVGLNYGQGGPQGQGFWSRGEPGYRGGPGVRHIGGYGGFGGQGYSRGEGSWRQGRWETGSGSGSRPQRQGDYDDRAENLQRGFGMSPYGGYGSREQGAYGGDEERGTWGGAGYQGGQGGYTGYPDRASEPQRQARAPRGYQRSDERIREDVCDTIVRMGVDAGDVDIKVERCEVTLSGTVDNRQDKRRLEDLAESVSGVKHVHNQLRVEEPSRAQQPRAASAPEAQTPSSGTYGSSAGKNGPQNSNRTQ